jgi:hypothetical protein
MARLGWRIWRSRSAVGPSQWYPPARSTGDTAIEAPRVHNAARRGGSVAARGTRAAGLGQKEMAITGKNRTMIYGPKNDGTYVVEFRTAAGEALAISIPTTEAAVIRHFQERMPYVY